MHAKILTWGTEGDGDGQFYNPSGIAVDGSGNIYVTDWNMGSVQVFSSSGEFLRKWGSEGSDDGQLFIPGGIVVDGSGNVYVAEYGNYRVQVFSSTGEFLRKWGSGGAGYGQFVNPYWIALDGSGNIYVSDLNNRVQVLSASGVHLDTLGYPNHGDTAASATPLLLDDELIGEIGHFDDADFFSFQAQTGQTYLITVNMETLIDSILTLFDTNGVSVLAFNDDYDDGRRSHGSQIVWSAPTTGTYYVAVLG